MAKKKKAALALAKLAQAPWGKKPKGRYRKNNSGAAETGRPSFNGAGRKAGGKPSTIKEKLPSHSKDNKTYTGKFISSAKGFGFINPAQGGADVFIPLRYTLDALNGDIVEYVIVKEGPPTINLDKPSRTGKITKITGRKAMVGTFYTMGVHGFVRPTDTKVPCTFVVPRKTISRLGLADGHVVYFELDSNQKITGGEATCHITEVIGHVHDPGMDVLKLVRQAGVQVEFPDKVMAEAANTPDQVSEDEIKGRMDLRRQMIFTIDGDDTKDIDDAISFSKGEDGNYQLGVHIADVTHYVVAGTALDASALDRGTSVYLADRVIPMLPHRLSSGICSLFPGVDRLTLSCIMTVSPKGHVLGYEIAETVINSKLRWTYNQVQDLLDTGDNSELGILAQQMDQLRQILHKKRRAKGALDFDLPESKIRVDETGWPISIEPHVRTSSTNIIEEFMILCNETVAAHFLRLEAPFVYRTHEAPSVEKIAKLGAITKNFGIAPPDKIHAGPIALQRLLAESSNTAASAAIATAVLHSLPQARYTPDNPTHYGLASQAYCHFTSPIRRYADLQAHRIIKQWLQGEDLEEYWEILHQVCTVCSQTERVAETLEREVEALKKVQYMQGKEGSSFDGVISGVTAWGVYVALPNTVEGVIPFEHLRNSRYNFDKDKNLYTRSTARGKKKPTATMPPVLTHGTTVKVLFVSASEEERKIIFKLVKE